jgi:hypothetical protein
VSQGYATSGIGDVLRHAVFVRHNLEAFFQRNRGIRLGGKHGLPRWRLKVVGLSLKVKLRFGNVGVSDDLVR